MINSKLKVIIVICLTFFILSFPSLALETSDIEEKIIDNLSDFEFRQREYDIKKIELKDAKALEKKYKVSFDQGILYLKNKKDKHLDDQEKKNRDKHVKNIFLSLEQDKQVALLSYELNLFNEKTEFLKQEKLLELKEKVGALKLLELEIEKEEVRLEILLDDLSIATAKHSNGIILESELENIKSQYENATAHINSLKEQLWFDKQYLIIDFELDTDLEIGQLSNNIESLYESYNKNDVFEKHVSNNHQLLIEAYKLDLIKKQLIVLKDLQLEDEDDYKSLSINYKKLTYEGVRNLRSNKVEVYKKVLTFEKTVKELVLIEEKSEMNKLKCDTNNHKYQQGLITELLWKRKKLKQMDFELNRLRKLEELRQLKARLDASLLGM